jgi:hypothetical protein
MNDMVEIASESLPSQKFRIFHPSDFWILGFLFFLYFGEEERFRTCG